MGEDDHDTGDGDDDGSRMRMQNGGRRMGRSDRKRSNEGGGEDDLGSLAAGALGVDLMQLPHAGLMPHTAFWPTGMDVQGADVSTREAEGGTGHIIRSRWRQAEGRGMECVTHNAPPTYGLKDASAVSCIHCYNSDKAL